MRSQEDLRKERDYIAHIRQEIDIIDLQIHDLLLRRTEVVEEIGRSKAVLAAGGTTVRPEREYGILRRLLERHTGRFPKDSLMRIWREIFNASVRLEEDFKIGFYTPTEMPEYLRFIERHYGSYARLVLGTTPFQVFQMLRDKFVSLGLFPLTENSDSSSENSSWGSLSWWSGLGQDLFVIDRLPADSPPETQLFLENLYTVASMPPRESGKDVSWFSVEMPLSISRRTFQDRLHALGAEPPARVVDVFRTPERIVLLLEIEGFFANAQPSVFSSLQRGTALGSVRYLGGYPLL